jgi:tetratricopeptide (TPR) repeat protein
MKLLVTFILFFGCSNLIAQPRTLPLTMGVAPEQAFKKAFNTDTAHFENREASENGKWLFVSYEKTDTFNFNSPFYKNNDNRDYISVGIAFYEKQLNNYHLKFTNDNAFYCATCDNVKGQGFTLNNDTIFIRISYGPSVAWANDSFQFIYNRINNRWELSEAQIDMANDEKEITNEHIHFLSASGVYLDSYAAEYVHFENYPSEKAVRVSLTYTPGHYNALLDSLKRFPKEHYKYLSKVFSTDNAEDFLSNEEIQLPLIPANNIGYFFEQANSLDVAKQFLDHVIAAYPKREVAYYNLGDVYKKKGMKKEAIDNYNTYISLMTERNLQHKIPQSVKDYVK